ncbi:MAG TPA: hypothetical protein DD435_04840 [Cyanobacteria bacterium UBA8530]|nr:hypothetical protein [Cyanobacteria bacterium UBA8530]
MKKICFLSAFFLFLLASCGDNPPVQPPDPLILPTPEPSVLPPFHEEREVLEGQKISVLLPKKNGKEETFPLLLFEHGYSLDENQALSRTPFPRLTQKEGWILASSTLGGAAHWGNEDAVRLHDALIEHLLAKYPVDREKIYFVGFSMGGGTALLCGIFGKYRPAAIASSQGFSGLSELSESKYFPSILQAYGNPESLASRSPLEQAEKLRGIPIYLEHGRFDSELPFEQSEKMKKRLDELGIPNSFRAFSGGHAESNMDAAGIVAFLRGKALP